MGEDVAGGSPWVEDGCWMKGCPGGLSPLQGGVSKCPLVPVLGQGGGYEDTYDVTVCTAEAECVSQDPDVRHREGSTEGWAPGGLLGWGQGLRPLQP